MAAIQPHTYPRPTRIETGCSVYRGKESRGGGRRGRAAWQKICSQEESSTTLLSLPPFAPPLPIHFLFYISPTTPPPIVNIINSSAAHFVLLGWCSSALCIPFSGTLTHFRTFYHVQFYSMAMAKRRGAARAPNPSMY